MNQQVIDHALVGADGANSESAHPAWRSYLPFLIAMTASLALVGLSVWFALRFADRQVKPLYRLVSAARSVGAGNYALRVEGRQGTDEIGLLNRAFNRMTEQIDRQTRALVSANSQLDERRSFIEAVLESVTAGIVSVGADGTVYIPVDVGQVMFGETTSMTGDGPLGYYLSNIFKGKWFSADTEMEAGCGITPIKYRNKSLVHSLQWAIGLEWYLLVNDPWRVVMSTDHPNGGSFLAYPQIIRLLMDRTYRRDVLKTVNSRVAEQSLLKDLDREYTLGEIAIITRSGPARALGLKQKGHLGVGADADVTIYTPSKNYQEMFELPRMVIKSGRVIVENGEIRDPLIGKTLHVAPDYDHDAERDIQDWFEKYYSIRWRNYPVDDRYLHDSELVPTTG